MLTTFYTEEIATARHHEVQRAEGATVTLSIAAALLGLVGALYSLEDGTVDVRVVLFLSGVLLALSVAGSMLSAKHFERSMHSFAQAGAYRDCLLALFDDEEARQLAALFKSRGELATLAGLRKAIKDPKVALKERSGGTGALEDAKIVEGDVEKYNPMEVNKYVTPIENGKHTWLNVYLARPWFDLYKQWNRLYLFLAALAVLVAVYALLTEDLGPRSSSEQRAPEAVESAP
ncbi:MAG TPA: hypothetical protein VF576_01640 [Rubricoccaceae bacterium]